MDPGLHIAGMTAIVVRRGGTGDGIYSSFSLYWPGRFSPPTPPKTCFSKEIPFTPKVNLLKPLVRMNLHAHKASRTGFSITTSAMPITKTDNQERQSRITNGH